ncbi:ABC-type multidrug transport system, ATPase and permease component [Corynebacterium mustelae]|uniref:Mycobactin import ATP-binding/permease protein IrtA n=1 Tax=Corynebacterium mustelae TaxID=571915 RepID=A0A0G3H278_9CORY|nr:ATP-binding cassette domain-containing protein [Corynebacterium mustelae]AKK06855.1 ABC-type multidrug transport system, ATPase and permease component [Corynebacterium mustelae]
MSKGIQGAVLRALGAKEHLATVTGSDWITPHVLRVDFHSTHLLDPAGESPSAWVRGWFPDPDGKNTLHQRGYTFLDSDSTTGTFSIAFLVHEPAGPASTWAVNAQPGDEIVFQRYGSEGFNPSDPPPVGYLLLGDAASWPGIQSIVASLPIDVPIKVIMEQHHEADNKLPFPKHPNLSVTWVPTGGDSRTLVNALRGTDYHGWRTWVAAESVATRLVRQALQIDHGQNKGTMHAQAYWVHGKAMGKKVEVETTAEQSTDQVARPASAVDKAESTPSILRPARTALITAGIAQGLLSLLEVAPLILFAELARRLLTGAERDVLVSLGITGTIIMLAGAAGTALMLFLLHLHDARFSAALRKRVLHKLTRMPLGWFRQRRTAEVKKLVQDDINALHYLVTHAVPDLVAAVVTPLTIVLYLFTIDWRLCFVLLVPVVLYVIVMLRMATADKPRMRKMLRYNATLPGDAERFITGQPAARIFGDDATINLPRQLSELRAFLTAWQLETINAKSASIQLNRPLTVMVLLSVAGTVLITTGLMPAAYLLPFLVLGTSFGNRLLSISYAANGLQAGMTAKTALELMLASPELAARSPGATSAPHSTAPADIRLHDVTFGYAPGQPILENVSLALPPGKVTAIVGPSGAGKSTIAALVARFWDPDSGMITLDGTDIKDIPEAQLHSHVATVLQDVQLIRGTIHDNIALGHPDATRAQVVAAATTAFIDQVIQQLPAGYDTVVDRDSLSGGQRQRIAIARALLGNPRAVILDEATAAADPDSEWAIRQGLSQLLKGRTVLIIAHRLHTIADADTIVVLDKGRIVEKGTDSALRKRGGLYATLTDNARKALQ